MKKKTTWVCANCGAPVGVRHQDPEHDYAQWLSPCGHYEAMKWIVGPWEAT